MQIGGYVLRMAYMQGMKDGQMITSSILMDGVGRAVILAGTIFLFVGLAYYARAKGRSSWWCLFALLSVIGLLVLACLKDRAAGGKGDKPYYGAKK
jgi:uncharacterized membrane protein YhaH (DUF805 family)